MTFEKPKIAIIQFPGSNCERETAFAVERANMQAVNFFWNESRKDLLNFDGYIIVGGFSYEDRCRSGVIAALDPIVEVLKIANAAGKPILGICNGAQILIESMLVPDNEGTQKIIALTNNKRIQNNKILGTGFYNNWIYVKNNKENNNIFLSQCKNDILHIPTAHGEGRFILAPNLYEKLIESNVGFLYYCDQFGKIISDYPVNPNGSEHNIAAIGNLAGNILAIMPHPERTLNGDSIFTSMHDYIIKRKVVSPRRISFKFENEKEKKYIFKQNTINLIIKLLITDNEAKSVEDALIRQGYTVDIHKYIFWEIEHDSFDVEKLKKEIMQSMELCNPNKEIIVSLSHLQNGALIFAREKEDMIALQKLNSLRKYHNINSIINLRRFILWQINNHDNDQKIIAEILAKNILTHPIIHEVFINEYFVK